MNRTKRFLVTSMAGLLASIAVVGLGLIADPEVLHHTRYLAGAGVMALFQGVMIGVGDAVGRFIRTREGERSARSHETRQERQGRDVRQREHGVYVAGGSERPEVTVRQRALPAKAGRPWGPDETVRQVRDDRNEMEFACVPRSTRHATGGARG